jgi:2-oxoglutarate/2-oxoacid ferredoxin oxidoreductase subunit alpha
VSEIEEGRGSKEIREVNPQGRTEIRRNIVEIVSDSGEGAQTSGQLFGTVSARMGNGVWTVEIIPAEIEPPHRSRSGASGNRIRIGQSEITNAGDEADLVVAFNEQVLYSRIDVGALKIGTIVFLDRVWGNKPDSKESYEKAKEDFISRGYVLVEIPLEEECRKIVEDPRRGKNIWVLGMLCAIYNRDMDLTREEVTKRFTKKGEKVVASNLALLEGGYGWALGNVESKFDIPAEVDQSQRVVMNGNQAIGLGIMAAGMEVCSMYPITPATSASHFLANMFSRVGGLVHQAEDEIAAVGFAIGASYAGKTAVTITSGPGLALKTEFLGLAVMAEIPLVIIVVQRGGPSTGLPTKSEQGDLLSVLYGSPGDSPKIVIAPATIEECFNFMVTARNLAEHFRGPVFVLTDANLATGQQPFTRPEPRESWLSPPVDQSPWDTSVAPYDWDPESGLSERPIPGQAGGEYVVTGLAHDERSKVAYESSINQRAMEMRSRKLASIQSTIRHPEVLGESEGDLLVVSWGSTLGTVEEAVGRLIEEGLRVSSIHLRFLSPMEPGLKEIFARFKKVMTVEINYSDNVGHPYIDEENCRTGQLAMLLRTKALGDVDCWSKVPGGPLPPALVEQQLRLRLEEIRKGRKN